MRSLERSHSRGIDQAHIADDRRHIETRKHSKETTWDDIAALQDKYRDLINSLPINDQVEDEANNDVQPEMNRETAVRNVERLRLPDDELIELTAEWGDVEIDEEALREATEKNGNPNSHGGGIFFSSGNLPMSDDSIYRHVGTSAIVDLMIKGFVRNKREAANALGMPNKRGFGTIGPTVYWYDGNSQKRDTADLVIQASKEAADRGYVTKDDVQGIWVTDKNTGEPVNLIDGQDHTGLEMAEHRA